MRRTLILLAFAATGCAGAAYFPNQAGGAASDISGPDVREAWLIANPEAPDSIAAGIRDAYFVTGMTEDEIMVITNPDRRATTSNGYWRRHESGNELRLQWYLSGEQWPFTDGREQPVCELVLTDAVLSRVRYCPPPADTTDASESR